MKYNIVDNLYEQTIAPLVAFTEIFEKNFDKAIALKPYPEPLKQQLLHIFNEVALAYKNNKGTYVADQVMFDLGSVEIANSLDEFISKANKLRNETMANKLNLSNLREMNAIVHGPFAKIIKHYRNEALGAKKEMGFT